MIVLVHGDGRSAGCHLRRLEPVVMDYEATSGIQARWLSKQPGYYPPPRRFSWIRRSVGLTLSRHLLRRCLVLQARAEAALATVISKPTVARDESARGVVIVTPPAPAGKI
jgi:hypothetical protein